MDKVYLKHPQTGDVQEVDDTPKALVAWMVKGYSQCAPPAPAAAAPPIAKPPVTPAATTVKEN